MKSSQAERELAHKYVADLDDLWKRTGKRAGDPNPSYDRQHDQLREEYDAQIEALRAAGRATKGGG